MTSRRDFLEASAIALLVAACSGDGTGPQSGDGPELGLIASPAATDSVTASPVQGLVVEVRDDAGRPAPGVVVRFTGILLPSGLLSMFVGTVAGINYGTLAVDTTDASGRALARVAFGIVAGPGKIEISVPLFGLADTAHFTVIPGAAASVRILPQDTAVYSGTSVQLRGNAVDRFNNPRPDQVGFSLFSTPAAIGSVTSAGFVSTTSLGRIGIVATASQARDTAFLSVVPRGTFAAVDYSRGRLITTGLDGSGYQVFGPLQLNGFVEPAWSSDGTELAVTPPFGASEIQRVKLNGAIASITLPTVAGLGVPAYWPAYSPDGQFIYFTNLNGAAGGIWRVRTDGSTSQAITSGGTHYRPTLSHDGQLVAFHALANQGVAIRVWDIQAQSYVSGETPGMFPEWSPVGDSLAFIDINDHRLRLMHRSGSGNRYVTGPEERFTEQQMTWSPDGRWILACAVSGCKLVEVRTGLILPLVFTTSFGNPAWRPGS